MKKSKILFLFALFAFLFMLTACFGGSDDTTVTTNDRVVKMTLGAADEVWTNYRAQVQVFKDGKWQTIQETTVQNRATVEINVDKTRLFADNGEAYPVRVTYERLDKPASMEVVAKADEVVDPENNEGALVASPLTQVMAKKASVETGFDPKKYEYAKHYVANLVKAIDKHGEVLDANIATAEDFVKHLVANPKVVQELPKVVDKVLETNFGDQFDNAVRQAGGDAKVIKVFEETLVFPDSDIETLKKRLEEKVGLPVETVNKINDHVVEFTFRDVVKNALDDTLKNLPDDIKEDVLPEELQKIGSEFLKELPADYIPKNVALNLPSEVLKQMPKDYIKKLDDIKDQLPSDIASMVDQVNLESLKEALLNEFLKTPISKIAIDGNYDDLLSRVISRNYIELSKKLNEVNKVSQSDLTRDDNNFLAFTIDLNSVNLPEGATLSKFTFYLVLETGKIDENEIFSLGSSDIKREDDTNTPSVDESTIIYPFNGSDKISTYIFKNMQDVKKTLLKNALINISSDNKVELSKRDGEFDNYQVAGMAKKGFITIIPVTVDLKTGGVNINYTAGKILALTNVFVTQVGYKGSNSTIGNGYYYDENNNKWATDNDPNVDSGKGDVMIFGLQAVSDPRSLQPADFDEPTFPNDLVTYDKDKNRIIVKLYNIYGNLDETNVYGWNTNDQSGIFNYVWDSVLPNDTYSRPYVKVSLAGGLYTVDEVVKFIRDKSEFVFIQYFKDAISGNDTDGYKIIGFDSNNPAVDSVFGYNADEGNKFNNEWFNQWTPGDSDDGTGLYPEDNLETDCLATYYTTLQNENVTNVGRFVSVFNFSYKNWLGVLMATNLMDKGITEDTQYVDYPLPLQFELDKGLYDINLQVGDEEQTLTGRIGDLNCKGVFILWEDL